VQPMLLGFGEDHSMQDYKAMNDRPAETCVTTFLKGALADAAVGVPKLEAMARAAGLLGERQRITNAKQFRQAKSALGIRSVRNGFGPGGAWLWALPRDREASGALLHEAPAASSTKRQPVRVEWRVPLDWVEGIECLQYHPPMTGIPQHRWRQFVDDSNNFISSIQAERAAQLGWDAWALFGCRRDRPGAAGIGLLWAVNGGRVVEIHRDWALIELAGNGSQRVFDRRRSVAANVALPWIAPDRRPREHR
jgi:hypothetical protein